MEKEIHKFDSLSFQNRWKTRRFSRNSEWLIVGAYKRWASVYKYAYIIGIGGLEMQIWIKREFHN